ncbi:MAG: hypothetical protein IKZ07_09400 [Akkermansia sp.]|nr:hypothetical protein [Akkermansia sp.]
MSHTWKKLSHHYYTNLLKKEKNNRYRYLLGLRGHYRYIQIHRAFSAHYHNSEEPGIRTRLLPLDPWEDLIVNRYGYLKPQRHSRLERRRAARKAAIREMDARLSGPGAA